MDGSPLIQEETEWGSGDRLEAARNFRAWVQVHVWSLRICSWPLNHQTRKLEGPSEINYPMLKTLHINNTNFLIFPPKSCHFPVYPPSAITASHLAAQARKPRDITDSYSFSLPLCPNSLQLQDLLTLPI